MKTQSLILSVFTVFLFMWTSCNDSDTTEPTIIMQSKIDTIDFTAYDESMSSWVFKKFLDKGLGNMETDAIDTFSRFGRYCVSISVGGNQLPYAGLDTGASFCVFNTDTINYQDSGENVSMTNIYGEPIDFRKIFLKNIRLSNTEFIPDKEIICGSGFKENILGGNFLKHFVWYFDNVKRKIYFSQDSTVFPYDNCIAIPFHLANDIPFIKCVVDSVEYEVMLDTGYPDFLRLVDRPNSNSIANSFIKQKESFYSVSILDDTNSIANYRKLRKTVEQYRTISNIEIGPLFLKEELVEHNSPVYNLLGWIFFQRFEFVVFDYLNQKLYLGPQSKFKHINYMEDLRIYVNTIGVAINPYEPFTIKSVMDKALMEKGLALGDTVIAIDGRPVVDLIIPVWNLLAKSAIITTKKENGFINYSLFRKNYIEEPDTVMSYGELTDLPINNKFSIYRPNSGGRIITYYDWIAPY